MEYPKCLYLDGIYRDKIKIVHSKEEELLETEYKELIDSTVTVYFKDTDYKEVVYFKDKEDKPKRGRPKLDV